MLQPRRFAVLAVFALLCSFAGQTSVCEVRKGTLKETLAKLVTTPPDIMQFAKDRKFEEAWIIKSSSARPSAEEYKKYLDKEKFKVLIVEYVWNSEVDDKRFVLTLYQDERAKMRDPEKLLKTSLDLFYEKPDFLTLIDTLDTEIAGKGYLLQGPVDAVSMGIFNYWVSTGPIDLWKVGDRYSDDAIREKIKSRPDIEKNSLNYQGLFFRYNVDGRFQGPYYGFKTPCCKKDGTYWTVDYPTTFQWMRFMLASE